jgi:hypothetical protein
VAGEASEHSVASGSDVVASATLQALVGRLAGQWQILAETEDYVSLISDSFNYVPIDAVCSRLRLVISLGDAVNPAENLFPLRQDQIFALKAKGDDGCNEVLLDDYFEEALEPGAQRRSLEVLIDAMAQIRAAPVDSPDIEFTTDEARQCFADYADVMKIAEATSRELEEGLEVTFGLRGCNHIRSDRWIFVSTEAQFEASEESLRFVVWHATAQIH